MERKLTTIFASDVVGFSKMMGEDEVNTLKILKERRLVIDKIINEKNGIIFGSAGDSVIAEFTSPIKASEAAIAIQSKMKTLNQNKSKKDKMIFRVGINIGAVSKSSSAAVLLYKSFKSLSWIKWKSLPVSENWKFNGVSNRIK